jgi:hypothetical protein
MSSEAKPPTSATANVLGIIGILAYGATGVLYLAGGLVVPGPWIVVLWAIWLAGLFALVRVFRDRRPWTPLVALVAAVFWWLFVTVGEGLLGWTA